MLIKSLIGISLIIAGIFLSNSAFAASKRIECWFIEVAYGYDITFDLATQTAELTYIQKKPFEGEQIHAGKVEEFPSVLRFSWSDTDGSSTAFKTSRNMVFDVNRETLKGTYKHVMKMGGAMGPLTSTKEYTASCTLKKTKARSNKI